MPAPSTGPGAGSCIILRMPPLEGPSPSSAVDLDLHGLVRIRLVDASPRDVAVVLRQVGPIRTDTPGVPDITIRFVDSLEFEGPLRLLGVPDAGYTDASFYVLRGKQKSRVRVRFPVDRIGADELHIVCERGLPAVPHLIAVVNLTALSRGVLPMHASAFVHDGTGILVTGWAKGGKTETLLAFASNGAEYVGDEWIYVTPDGRMLGIPEPIRVWDWQLGELPEFRATASRTDRIRLRMLAAASRGLGAMARSGTRIGSVARRVRVLVEGQRYLHMEPDRIFREQRGRMEAPLEKLLFVASHDDPENRINPVTSREVADRMLFSLLDERAGLMSLYHQYRFAFPDRSNSLIDGVESIQRRLLGQVLDGVDAYEVMHPYPVSIPGLYDTIAPVLARGSSRPTESC